MLCLSKKGNNPLSMNKQHTEIRLSEMKINANSNRSVHSVMLLSKTIMDIYLLLPLCPLSQLQHGQ